MSLFQVIGNLLQIPMTILLGFAVWKAIKNSKNVFWGCILFICGFGAILLVTGNDNSGALEFAGMLTFFYIAIKYSTIGDGSGRSYPSTLHTRYKDIDLSDWPIRNNKMVDPHSRTELEWDSDSKKWYLSDDEGYENYSSQYGWYSVE